MKRSRPDLTQRNAEIAKRVIAGEDYAAVGADYGIKSERVRQVTCRTMRRAVGRGVEKDVSAHIGFARDIKSARENSTAWITLIDKTVVKP